MLEKDLDEMMQNPQVLEMEKVLYTSREMWISLREYIESDSGS